MMRLPTIVLAASLLLASSCSKPPDELERGVAAMRWMVSERFLRRSMFLACYEDPKPSDFVNYLFSTVGAAEWPEVEGDAGPPGSRGIGAPPALPEGVRFHPVSPDPGYDGPQVVVGFDDEAGEVVIEGYAHPAEPPVLVRRAKLPRIELTEDERRIVEPFARSALDSGASAYDGLP